MEIGQTYKKPNQNAKPFFDGMEKEDANFSFQCGSCKKIFVSIYGSSLMRHVFGIRICQLIIYI